MKTSRKIIGVLCLIVGLSAFVFYPHLPMQIPTHWGINGEINQYGSKNMIFVFSFIPLLVFAGMELFPKIDPRKDSYELHARAYETVKYAIVFFMIGLYIITAMASLGYRISVDVFVKAGVGILFIVLGNVLSQVRPNYFFGIRTPWTLANETVWRKTHRVSAYAFVLCGVISFISAFIHGTLSFIMVLGSILGSTFFLFVYSYIIYRKIVKE